MDVIEISLTKGQKEKLKKLLTIIKANSVQTKKKFKKAPEDNIIHTVDDVIKEAKKNSSAIGDSLEDLRDSAVITERGKARYPVNYWVFFNLVLRVSPEMQDMCCGLLSTD